VRGHKNQRSHRAASGSFQLRAKAFVFFDRTTGTKRFEVEAGPDGSLPVEKSTSLLAMQCVVRGQTPEDFRVMVSVGENLVEGLAPGAKKLIEASMATALPMHITHRQQEVLRGVLENLSNKEIAAKINLAERTVKFHVSALLQKFHVTGRVSLMQKAGDMLTGGSAPSQVAAVDVPTMIPNRSVPAQGALHPQLVRLAAGERRASR
jgi:DNA-binding CsgD family transcriptional regulator